MQNFIISLFQVQDNTQNALEQIKAGADKVSNSVLNYALIGVSAIAGLVVVAAIIFFAAKLIQAKFAGPEQKKVIYRNIKHSAWTFAAVILLLVIGVSVIAVINNITGSFVKGVQDIIVKK